MTVLGGRRWQNQQSVDNPMKVMYFSEPPHIQIHHVPYELIVHGPDKILKLLGLYGAYDDQKHDFRFLNRGREKINDPKDIEVGNVVLQFCCHENQAFVIKHNLDGRTLNQAIQEAYNGQALTRSCYERDVSMTANLQDFGLVGCDYPIERLSCTNAWTTFLL